MGSELSTRAGADGGGGRGGMQGSRGRLRSRHAEHEEEEEEVHTNEGRVRASMLYIFLKSLVEVM